jgi:outer membrane receptor protein involved in Fe transport
VTARPPAHRRFGQPSIISALKWRDIQVQAGSETANPDGTLAVAFGTDNAAAASSRGVELNATFKVVDGLRFEGSLGYLDARFDRYGLVTVLRRSPISLRHLSFECERADAAQI